MPPEGYTAAQGRTNLNVALHLSVLEARLAEIRAKQALTIALDKFKEQFPGATVGEILSFKIGYKAAQQK